MISQIIMYSVIALFVIVMSIVLLARVWYPAAVIYHYVAEHDDYLLFKKALDQIKSGEAIPIYPLTYWVYSDLMYKYETEWKDQFVFIVHDDGPSLYRGGDIVLTGFSWPLVDHLVKLCGINKKAVRLFRLMEMDADQYTYSGFLDKYIELTLDEKANPTLSLNAFTKRWLNNKRIELGMPPLFEKKDEEKPQEEKPQDEQPAEEVKVEEATKVEEPVVAMKNPEEKPKKKTTKKATKKPAKKTTKKATKKEEQA